MTRLDVETLIAREGTIAAQRRYGLTDHQIGNILDQMAGIRAPIRDTCGTRAGYETHLRNYERPCDDCRDDKRARDQQAREQRSVLACGTPAGYWKHRRAKTTPCQACLDSLAEQRRGAGAA